MSETVITHGGCREYIPGVTHDSIKTMQALCEALGIGNRKVIRLVLVCETDEPLMAYFTEYVEEQGAKLASVLSNARVAPELVSDVVVDNGGNVFVEDLVKPSE